VTGVVFEQCAGARDEQPGGPCGTVGELRVALVGSEVEAAEADAEDIVAEDVGLFGVAGVMEGSGICVCTERRWGCWGPRTGLPKVVASTAVGGTNMWRGGEGSRGGSETRGWRRTLSSPPGLLSETLLGASGACGDGCVLWLSKTAIGLLVGLRQEGLSLGDMVVGA
jgi:hypothetical protein